MEIKLDNTNEIESNKGLKNTMDLEKETYKEEKIIDVERYYKKAYISLPEDEAEKKNQIERFNKIANLAEKLMEIDTTNFEEFEITSQIDSPLREDEVLESIDRELIFSNTSHREYGYFKLDKIMED